MQISDEYRIRWQYWKLRLLVAQARRLTKKEIDKQKELEKELRQTLQKADVEIPSTIEFPSTILSLIDKDWASAYSLLEKKEIWKHIFGTGSLSQPILDKHLDHAYSCIELIRSLSLHTLDDFLLEQDLITKVSDRDADDKTDVQSESGGTVPYTSFAEGDMSLDSIP